LDKNIERQIAKGLQEGNRRAWLRLYEAVLNDIVKTFENSKGQKLAVPQPNIWRIITKSRITKLGAAAAVIIAFILSMTLSDKTVAPAFSMNDVLAAMAKAEWLHMTWEFTKINTKSDTTGQEIRESWTRLELRWSGIRDTSSFKWQK